jgi:hypothetical protein
VSIDARSLDLAVIDGVRTGRIDVHVYCGDARQTPIGERTERLDLRADTATYAGWLETGLRQAVQVPVASRARYVKVIVYDHGSGRIGSRSVAVGESGIFTHARFPDLQFAR